MTLIERTCDRCAQRWPDCTVIDDAYICGACRADIEAEEAEVNSLREQLRGAVSESARLECALQQVRARLDEGDNDGAYATVIAALDPRWTLPPRLGGQ